MRASASMMAACAIFSAGADARPQARAIAELATPMSDYAAACIIQSNPTLVSAWLSTMPGSAEEKAVARRQAANFPVCFGTNLSQTTGWIPVYDYTAMRVKLITYILRMHLAPLPEAPTHIDSVVWYENTGKQNPPATSLLANSLGFCLARSDWPTTRTLVQSAAASRAETEAVIKLVPLISGCVPTGKKLTMDRIRLRVILEETAYHAVGGASAAMLQSPAGAA